MVFSILSPSKKPAPPEIGEDGVNYDDGPTKLYSLIENREWKAAVLRATKTPIEAGTWIYRTEKSSDKLRWKQLPIHAAIVFGANEVVVHALLRSYPEGAELTDDQGMLPIHLAFRHNANEEVIDMLLKIYPEGANLRDRKGRIPITLVRVTGEGECTTLRSYMANFIFERSNVVVAEQKERKIKEMTDTYNDEIRNLQIERENENKLEWEKLLKVEDHLMRGNKVFEKWSKDVQPDRIEFHTKDYLSRDELHDSLIYTIDRFAQKAEQMEAEKEKGIIEGKQEVIKKMKEMEMEHLKDLDELKLLIEGKKPEEGGMEETAPTKEQEAQLASIKKKLLDRMSTLEQHRELLQAAKDEGKSYSDKILDLSNKIAEVEKTAQEEKMNSEKKYMDLETSTESLKIELDETRKEVERMNKVDSENTTLHEKVEELLGTMVDVRRETQAERDLAKQEAEKNAEALELTKEALAQASETVQTLEDQMAKLYVEKEGLRSRFYSLQQSTSKTGEDNEETISNLKTELDSAKNVMKMQSEKIKELTNKFDGLTAIRQKEIDISRGKETLLSAKVEHLTTKYESFQQEIDDYNERSEQYNQELEHQKSIVTRLQKELAMERRGQEVLEEELREAKEKEELLTSRVQDLAGNLARVSMERKNLASNFAEEKESLKEKAISEKNEYMDRVNELQRIMNGTEESMEKYEKRCKELENENESLRNSLEEMAKKLVRSALEQRTGIQTYTKQKASLESENENLQKSISAMKSEIENITSNYSAVSP